ncbi:hypothetical protein Patl1_27814 [Pistacia atlantica]|uniref:Uncharacterized protein n=1 Tax=Pistacia atlantica TaxID=434234 RepID=A0ACC1BC83_9ROSI|nr:hypothetical protein Patl1_27814 [Pistacia atlantica]
MVVVLLLVLLSAKSVATRQKLNISLGSSLTPTGNSSWLSPSGLYGFGFHQQRDGFAVGIFIARIAQKTVVWTANRNNPPVPADVTLTLTRAGRFILQSREGQETSIVRVSKPAARASILDSGNFILYNSDEKIIWQSFVHPTDTLLPGQRLLARQQMYPTVNPDGGKHAYWLSHTAGRDDNVSLNLAVDGHLYLLNSTDFNIKNLTPGGYSTEETIYLMKIDIDGIFRLYSYKLNQNNNRSIVWASSDDKCSPKGLCGPNEYCVQNDQEIRCQCLPGYASIKEGSQASGCQNIFSPESCNSTDGNIKYNIETVANISWEDSEYSNLKSQSKDECEQACLKDCSCEAAMFKDGKFVGVLVYRNQVCKYNSICTNGKIPLEEDVGPKSFTYSELLEATNNFNEEAGQLGEVVRDEDVDKLQLERTVKVGLWCIQYEPSLRPSMKKVLLMLVDIVDIPLPPNPTSSLSAI